MDAHTIDKEMADNELQMATKHLNDQQIRFLTHICNNTQDFFSSSNLHIKVPNPDKKDTLGDEATVMKKKVRAIEDKVGSDRFFERLFDFASEAFEKQIFKDWDGDVSLSIELKDDTMIRLGGRKHQYNDMLQQATPQNEQIEFINITLTNISRSRTFRPPLSLIDLKLFFGLLVGDLDRLKAYAKERLIPIAGTRSKWVVEPNLDYINVDGDNPFDTHDPNIHTDKSYAYVVTGESGSGKSVHSCLQAERLGYLPVYCLIGKDGVAYPQKPTSDFPSLNGLLRKCIIACEKNEGRTDIFNYLCSMKACLNPSRNAWARSMLHTALKDYVDGSSEDSFSRWLDGWWSEQVRPEKVAIIVDEATDTDLAEGLVATVRESKALYEQRLARSDVMIIITGTGLEGMKCDNRVGTSPCHSRVVQLMSPSVESVKTKGALGTTTMETEAIFSAIQKGSLSRIMMTNARMLFCSVLPILLHTFHRIDGLSEGDEEERCRRLEDRLSRIASFGPIMDHGPRFYVNQNTVGSLTRKQRDMMLKHAFLYHLDEAVKIVDDSECRLASEVRRNGIIERTVIRGFEEFRTMEESLSGSRNLFSCGLAGREYTSNALKYLACFGLTCEIRPAFGNDFEDFEELVALHYMRYMQAQGYNTTRVGLKYDWPPKKNESDDSDSHTLEKLRERLAKQDEDLDGVVGVGGTDKLCVLFSQGTPTAQGGDILALVIDGDEGRIEPIQCKQYQKRPSSNEMMKWWESVGVQVSNDGNDGNDGTFSADCEPNGGSAGYSFVGLDGFRALCEDKTRKRVSIGKRTLAVSFGMEAAGDEFPIPRGDSTRVWFREMLEPTISLCELNEGVVVDGGDGGECVGVCSVDGGVDGRPYVACGDGIGARSRSRFRDGDIALSGDVRERKRPKAARESD